MWKPQLFERELYSEILDKKFTVTVTMRTLDLIDEAYGFDFYILKASGVGRVSAQQGLGWASQTQGSPRSASHRGALASVQENHWESVNGAVPLSGQRLWGLLPAGEAVALWVADLPVGPE